MGTRELLILILGLAVIAVILRGLYVAMHARRNQIRMAIDRNIPQDVDLEELVMADFPNGGARVVRRSLKAVNQQNTLQNELDLGTETDTESEVPILLDTVEIKGRREQQTSDDNYYDEEDAEAYEEDTDYDKQAVAELDDWQDDEDDEERDLIQQAEDFDEDSDDEDCEVESLDSDFESDDDEDDYEDEYEEGRSEPVFSSEEEDPEEDEVGEAMDADDAEDAESEDLFDEEYDEPSDDLSEEEQAYQDEDFDEESEYQDQQAQRLTRNREGDDSEPGFDDLMEDDFGDFSLSAGERIGAPETSAATGGAFKNRFGSGVGGNDAGKTAGKKDSLFSRFGKKNAERQPEQNELWTVRDARADLAGEDDELDPLFKKAAPDRRVEQVKPRPEVRQRAPAPEQEDKSGVADINQARESRRPAATAASGVSAPARDNGKRPVEPSEVLVINVMSHEGELFNGADLVQALITSGLKHGDMNIFHKHLENDAENPVIFSVANILNPGTFDLDAIEDFHTRGVSLFLAMPSIISNRDAFEEMLRTAQQVRAALDGELRDDRRNVMTAQTVEHYRQRIHDYELRKLKAAQARS